MCASYVGSTVGVCDMASGEERWGAGGGGGAKWGFTSGIFVL